MKTFGKKISLNFQFYFLVIPHPKYLGSKIFFKLIFIHLPRDFNFLWPGETFSIHLTRPGPNYSVNEKIGLGLLHMKKVPLLNVKATNVSNEKVLFYLVLALGRPSAILTMLSSWL